VRRPFPIAVALAVATVGVLVGPGPARGAAASPFGPLLGPAHARSAPSLVPAPFAPRPSLVPAPFAPRPSVAVASAPRTPPIRLTARFGASARLERSTALSIGLRIDRKQVKAMLTDVRILTPANLDITMSALGTASCRRPATDFDRVRIENLIPVTCPDNALLGSGTAAADLQFSEQQAIPGAGRLRLFTGTPVDGRPGLVVLVSTVHPIVTQLVYGGYLYTAPRPYGLGMRIRIPAMADPPFGSPVALVGLQMTIGGDDIVYTRRERGHRIHYTPGGIPLPKRCPPGGFPFRALMRFDDGRRRTADTVVRCPKRSR
jgi:hypothetical protein